MTLFNRNGRRLQLGFSPETFLSLDDVNQARFNAVRWIMPLSYRNAENLQLKLAPFFQTNHDGFGTIDDDCLFVFRLNIKNF